MTISPELGWATVGANAGIATGQQVFWHVVTRLGEMQIVLPAGLAAASALYWTAGARHLVRRWMGLLALATLLTAASKLAFIGWGLGWPEANFTGISGHAMLAAALYPLILASLVSGMGTTWRKGAATFGFGLAMLIGMSRVIVGAHSASEVVAGLLLGCATSGAAMDLDALQRAAVGRALVALAAIWFILMPVHAPPSQTHSLMVRVSLALSGHKAPYTRNDMLRKLRRQGSACHCPGTSCAAARPMAWAIGDIEAMEQTPSILYPVGRFTSTRFSEAPSRLISRWKSPRSTARL